VSIGGKLLLERLRRPGLQFWMGTDSGSGWRPSTDSATCRAPMSFFFLALAAQRIWGTIL